MALQVWLPLNGNSNNQGIIGNTIQTSTPNYMDGKIGKAMGAGSFYMTAEQTSQILNNKALSICFWIKVIDNSTKTMIFGNGDTGSYNNRKFSIFQYPTVNDLHLSWMNDDGNKTFINGVWTAVFPTDVWTHCTVTYENPVCKIYINGNLYDTISGVSDSSSFKYDTILIHNNSTNSRLLNDFRIYDHCLSAKEVKEISKGLVLHYKLDNNGMGNPNLVKNSHTFMTGFGYDAAHYDLSEPLIINQLYTITIKANLSEDRQWIGVWSDYGNCNFSGLLPRQSESNIYKFTVTCDSGNAGHSMFTIFSSNNPIPDMQGNTPITGYCQVEWIKLEKGSKATPWCPNENDTLYSQLGLNSNIESDCSGYGNDGIIEGNVDIDSESPRYDVSYSFDKTAGRNIHRSDLKFLNNNITFACWIKQTNYSGQHGSEETPLQFIISQGRDYRESADFSFGFNIVLGGSELLIISGDAYAATGVYLNLNEWYHVVQTYDGEFIRLYINGELRYTVANSRLLWNNNADTLSIGEMSLGVGNPYYFFPFVGSISDVRIYSTTLSDSDIKELYNSSISIDKNGNLLTYEFKEE